MSAVTADLAGGHGEAAHHEGAHDATSHHSPLQKDRRERLALWLFIGGDLLFLLLELFTWFYLRALNTNGMWRGALCTVAKPCSDGLGNSITHEIAKANPAYTSVIAILAVVTALAVWGVESAARKSQQSSVVGLAGVGLVAILAAVAVQCFQFGKLPFQTIDGSYASAFQFFMGSTLVHLILLAFIMVGLFNRARVGRYSEGHWYQARIIRMFAVWIAVSTCVLALVMSLAA